MKKTVFLFLSNVMQYNMKGRDNLKMKSKRYMNKRWEALNKKYESSILQKYYCMNNPSW